MIVVLAVSHMFIDIDQALDVDLYPDLFLHFPMQGRKDPFPMLDLAAGHDPQAVKGVNTAAGEKNAIVRSDDTGND